MYLKLISRGSEFQTELRISRGVCWGGGGGEWGGGGKQPNLHNDDIDFICCFVVVVVVGVSIWKGEVDLIRNKADEQGMNYSRCLKD